MKYGYARVSTDGPNPALQLAASRKAGCQAVFKDEGLSGATTKRSALLRCLKKLEHGDTLIVWKLDRLGRSLRGRSSPSAHARKLIDKGEARQYVADLLNVNRTTLYRAIVH